MDSEIKKSKSIDYVKMIIQWIVFPAFFNFISGLLISGMAADYKEVSIFIISGIAISWIISFIVMRFGKFSLLKSFVLNVLVPFFNFTMWGFVAFYFWFIAPHR